MGGEELGLGVGLKMIRVVSTALRVYALKVTREVVLPNMFVHCLLSIVASLSPPKQTTMALLYKSKGFPIASKRDTSAHTSLSRQDDQRL